MCYTDRISHENASLSRRDFFSRIVPGAIATGLASKHFGQISPEKQRRFSQDVPPSTPDNSEAFSTLSARNITFQIDSNNLPISYTQTLADGSATTTLLDQGKVLAQKALAIDSQIPQIVATIDFPSIESAYKPSPEHPQFKELLPDTLGAEDVKQRGVHIIQSDNTTLFVRKAAFEKDGPLEAFNNTGRKLEIILVDGPIVHSAFMKDAQYAPYVEDIKSMEDSIKNSIEIPDTQSMRRILKKDFETFRTDAQKRLLGSLPATNARTTAEANYVESSLDILDMENVEDKRILARYISAHAHVSITGLYVAPLTSQDSARVFIATGSTYPTESVALFFSSDGQPAVETVRHQFGHDNRPKPEENIPDPNAFVLNTAASPSDPTSYPYGGQTVGFTLNHELIHDKFIEQVLLLLKGGKPDFSEYNTDMGSIDMTRKGWIKWTSSQDTDSTGYFFLWSIPSELGSGFITTKKLDKTAQNAQAA